MISLRNRIAAMQIFGIVMVILLATLAALQLHRRPLPEAALTPIAREISWLAGLAASDPDRARSLGMTIENAPASSPPETRETRLWTRLLGRAEHEGRLIVSSADRGRTLTISLELGDHLWLVMPLPDLRPPRGGAIIFVGWMTLIVVGAAVVSVIAATRITGPLRMLDGAVDRIGNDGVLAHLPESGPPETQATARALNRLSARLKTAMESRMRLVAAAGHDLRTPMTRMRLRAEFIEDDDERAKWLADLNELDGIADSAIHLVRDEAGAEAVQLFRLDSLLSEVVAELADQGLPVTLHPHLPIGIRAEPLGMKRALRNLIINSATHGGGATVGLRRVGAQAVVEIRDEGPGIPDYLLERAFELFFRVDPARRKSLPGAGLGMAIARQVIERQGGVIRLTNRQPHGLLQEIILPAIGDASQIHPNRGENELM